MATKREVMAVGTAFPLARMLGSDHAEVVAPAGNSQDSATTLEGNFILLTGAGAANQGVRLPPAGGQFIHMICNADPALTAYVYPDGGEYINAMAPGQAAALPPLAVGLFVPSRRQWIAIIAEGSIMSTQLTLYVPGNAVPLVLEGDPAVGGPYIQFGPPPPAQTPLWQIGVTLGTTQGFGLYPVVGPRAGYGVWIDQNADCWVDGNLSVGGGGAADAFTVAGNSTLTGNLTVTGTITGTVVPPPSDRRLKDDVEPFRRGLDAIMRLEPVSWRWNGRGGTRDDGRRHYGFLADAVEPLIPEAVGTREVMLVPGDELATKIWTLDTEAIFGALVGAVRELGSRVENLERLVSK